MKKTLLIAGLAALALIACGKKPSASAAASAVASAAASAAASVATNTVGKLPKMMQLELQTEPGAAAKYIGKTWKLGGVTKKVDAAAGKIMVQGMGDDLIPLTFAKDKAADLANVKEGEMAGFSCTLTGTEGASKIPQYKDCSVIK